VGAWRCASPLPTSRWSIWGARRAARALLDGEKAQFKVKCTYFKKWYLVLSFLVKRVSWVYGMVPPRAADILRAFFQVKKGRNTAVRSAQKISPIGLI
jgi:hypothetical protein